MSHFLRTLRMLRIHNLDYENRFRYSMAFSAAAHLHLVGNDPRLGVGPTPARFRFRFQSAHVLPEKREAPLHYDGYSCTDVGWTELT